jgi:peptidoglycan/xylan/chitin deacetylase (PgdA/CDA1 family)
MHAHLSAVFSIALALSASAHHHNSHFNLHARSASTPNSHSLEVRWHHPEGHTSERLFRRASSPGSNYPPVGSSEWRSRFPSLPLKGEHIPDTWIAALNQSINAGLIPDLPIPKPGEFPIYPNGTDPSAAEICSASYNCRGALDLWDAPDGITGISFDDGPLPASPKLYDFLKSQNQAATHFFIGANILDNSNIFLQAFENGDDIAVHTYTHPYMTTLPNVQIVAELGWTMQIIHDSTGGRIPKYWRPPYGDVDNRVRAIARHVFGLTTVIWNRDLLDWELGTPYMTPARVQQNLTAWYTGPKSPGLIILEHELSNETVDAFIKAYPLIKQNGWEARSVAQILGGPAYLNVDGGASSSRNSSGVMPLNVAQSVTEVLASQSSAAAATGGMEPGATQTVSISVSGSRVTPTGGQSGASSAPSASSKGSNNAVAQSSTNLWFISLLSLVLTYSLHL